MKHNPFTSNLPSWQTKPRKLGNPVSKMTLVAGKRIGGALRAENARQQKRKDTRR
jgi:hypothetical protein